MICRLGVFRYTKTTVCDIRPSAPVPAEIHCQSHEVVAASEIKFFSPPKTSPLVHQASIIVN